MRDISRFGVSVERELLESFDQLIKEQGYDNRSEALRDLMRDHLVKSRLEKFSPTDEAVCILTFVYNQHADKSNSRIKAIQRDNYNFIVSVLNVYIDPDEEFNKRIFSGRMQFALNRPLKGKNEMYFCV